MSTCTSRFPISRDPPEGGTLVIPLYRGAHREFPISRDPPEGGTMQFIQPIHVSVSCFQFLGIPPKGELLANWFCSSRSSSSFQFLGIPPKGERLEGLEKERGYRFPISRDPPEGGTTIVSFLGTLLFVPCRFQFLGIPPKGEQVYVIPCLGG